MNRDLTLIACGMCFTGSAVGYASGDTWSAILMGLAAMSLAAIANQFREAGPARKGESGGGEANRPNHTGEPT